MKPVTASEFAAAADRLLTRAAKNWTQKNACYSLDEAGGDTLANINMISEMLEVSPEKVVLTYMTKHYLAVASAVQRGDDGGELLLERLSDILNYLKMLAALHEHRSPVANWEPPPRHQVPLTKVDEEDAT